MPHGTVLADIISERVEGVLQNYDFVISATLAYFIKRPPQAEKNSDFALAYVKQHAKTPRTSGSSSKRLNSSASIVGHA